MKAKSSWEDQVIEDIQRMAMMGGGERLKTGMSVRGQEEWRNVINGSEVTCTTTEVRSQKSSKQRLYFRNGCNLKPS